MSDLLDLARYENAVASFDVRVFDIERVLRLVDELLPHGARTTETSDHVR